MADPKPGCQRTSIAPRDNLLAVAASRAVASHHEGERRSTPPRSKEGPAPTPSGVGLAAPRTPAAAMLHDLITSFLVAFAAITPSQLLTKIWESL